MRRADFQSDGARRVSTLVVVCLRRVEFSRCVLPPPLLYYYVMWFGWWWWWNIMNTLVWNSTCINIRLAREISLNCVDRRIVTFCVSGYNGRCMKVVNAWRFRRARRRDLNRRVLWVIYSKYYYCDTDSIDPGRNRKWYETFLLTDILQTWTTSRYERSQWGLLMCVFKWNSHQVTPCVVCAHGSRVAFYVSCLLFLMDEIVRLSR